MPINQKLYANLNPNQHIIIYKDNYIIWLKPYYSYNTCLRKFVIVNLDNLSLKLYYSYFGAKLFLKIPTTILLKYAIPLKVNESNKEWTQYTRDKHKKRQIKLKKKNKKVEDLRANAKCIKHLSFNPFL